MSVNGWSEHVLNVVRQIFMNANQWQFMHEKMYEKKKLYHQKLFNANTIINACSLSASAISFGLSYYTTASIYISILTTVLSGCSAGLTYYQKSKLNKDSLSDYKNIVNKYQDLMDDINMQLAFEDPASRYNGNHFLMEKLKQFKGIQQGNQFIDTQTKHELEEYCKKNNMKVINDIDKLEVLISADISKSPRVSIDEDVQFNRNAFNFNVGRMETE